MGHVPLRQTGIWRFFHSNLIKMNDGTSLFLKHALWSLSCLQPRFAACDLNFRSG